MKKELNSKDELIKRLVVTAIVDTVGKSKRSEEKEHLQVEPSPILTTVQHENQSHHKNTIYVGSLHSNVSIEDIYELFSLKSTAYLRTNCHVSSPLNQQTHKNKGHVYITATKHVCDELVNLNGVEFKRKCLFIEDGKIKPKEANPNALNFTSPNRFQPFRFMNNGPDLGNNLDDSEENDFYVDFKRTARNFQQNSKCISRRRPLIVVNAHPENQTTFFKQPIFPGDKSYSDAVTKKAKQKQQKNILIFSDSIPSRIKMYDLNKA